MKIKGTWKCFGPVGPAGVGQWRVVNVIRVMKHLAHEDGSRDLVLFIMEKRRLQGNLTVVPSVPEGSLQENCRRTFYKGM